MATAKPSERDPKFDITKRYPANASEEYKAARAALSTAEYALRQTLDAVATQRRSLPPGAPMGPHTFHDALGPTAGQPIALADLFPPPKPATPTSSTPAAGTTTLVVYHLMFRGGDAAPCAMCAAFVDSLAATARHLAARGVGVAVVAKTGWEALGAYAARRGWDAGGGVRFVSSAGDGFNAVMNMEDGAGAQMPGVSVFTRRVGGDGEVRHVYTGTAMFDGGQERGLDWLSPLWNVLEMVPEGRGTEYTSNEYIVLKE